jgi:acetoin utilization protein AcuB
MKIQDVMTSCPYKIEVDCSHKQALELMNLRGIRHLPVVDQGELVGVLSKRDLELSSVLFASSETGSGIRELCAKNPYIVASDQDLGQVAREMSERKIDCALVSDAEGNLVGIFTTTDACRLIHLILEEMKKD